jgi:hypothetical protein
MAAIVIPGYAEAIAREVAVRERAYLPGAPLAIGPFPVVEICPWHLILFEQIASPIFNPANRPPEVRDLFDALWILSTGFSPGNSLATRWRRWKMRRRFAWHIWWHGVGDLMDALYDHTSDAFIDQLAGAARSGPQVRYTSWIADTVDMIAAQYGWTDSQVIHTPMIRINQYLKRIQLRTEGDKSIMFNRSDKIKADYLAEVNAKRAAERETEAATP